MKGQIYRSRMMGLIVSLAMCMASCNHSDPLGEIGDVTYIPEEELADKLSLVLLKENETLATSSWEDYQTAGIYVTSGLLDNPYQGNDELYSNIYCRNIAGQWFTEPADIPLAVDRAVVFAYTPYRTLESPRELTVECASGDVYMYGCHELPQTGVRKGDATAQLRMKHFQSLLDFRVRKDSEDRVAVFKGVSVRRKLPEGAVVTGDNYTSDNGLPVQAVGDIASGNLTTTKWGYHHRGVEWVLDTHFTTAHQLLIPVIPCKVYQNKVELLFFFNDKTIVKTIEEGKDWVRGKKSVFNVTFTGEDVVIDLEIEPWLTTEIKVEID